MNNTPVDLPPYKSTFKTEEGKAAVLSIYQSILENWFVPYEEINLSTTFGNTYLIKSGSENNPPLILLHGTSSNSSMWIGEVAEYSKNYLVYAIDIPGEPGRSEERQYPLKSSVYYEWLHEVISLLGLRSISLVAISLGAWLATGYACRHPQNVAKLVLLCPSGIGSERASFVWKALFCMLQGERGYDKLSSLVNGGQDIPEEAKAYTKLIAKSFHLRPGQVPVYTDEDLKQLQMPLLLMVGEKDVILNSEATANRIKALLPHAKVNYLKGQGHVLVGFQKEILTFLMD